MTRPGRKRKARVTRQPNGRPRQPTAQDIMAVARAGPHRQILDARGRVPDPRDPRLGTEFGRLRIMGLISAEQYAAGLRWGRVVIRMCCALGAQPSSPKGWMANLLPGVPGGLEMTAEQAAEARLAYDEAHHALVRDLGLGDRRVLPNLLRQVIVEDRACLDLIRFRGALDILARHFEATEKRICASA